ncbi:MAG: hypothetical protein E7562_01380 [Ruminococcaceae bacterium]|nr:hypothetical protein [Oscillospiraceae bacterium]
MNIIGIITLTAFIILAIILSVYHFIPNPSQKSKNIIYLCTSISIILFIINCYYEDILFFYDSKTNNTSCLTGTIINIEENKKYGLYLEIDNSKYHIDDTDYTKSGNLYELSDFSEIKISKRDKVTIIYGKSSKRIIKIEKSRDG